MSPMSQEKGQQFPRPRAGAGHPLLQNLATFRRRLQLRGLWQGASVGLLTGATAGCAVALGMLTLGQRSPLWLPPALSLSATLGGLLLSLRRPVGLGYTARWIDSQFGLKDRLETGLRFLAQSELDAVQRLQIEDAARTLESINPDRVVKLQTPQNWNRGLILSAAAILLTILSTAPGTPTRAEQLDPVLVEQSTRLQEDVQKLEEFQKEQPDTDLKQLLESMNRNLQELSKAGTTPREAFARLSEMESSLQQLQKQINDPATAEQLKDIGEALSLSADMSTAGKALAAGDLKKADAELSKLSAPSLDRQTQRAVTEKLKQVRKGAEESGKSRVTGEAAGKLAEGLQSGDSQKFQEGARGLASEARRLANQKQLSELLQQQALSLAQARSEVESEARNVAQGQGKGGKKAGKGTAGEPKGDKTAQKAAGKELRLTGENTGTGETDTEKTEGEQQEQVAEREYRQNAEKFEALSEAALESEPIPAGQKQLIRRYFQMIRPKSVDADGTADSPKN